MLLSDICEIIMGQSPSSDSYNVKGQGLPFFQGNADFGKLYPSVRLWCNCPIKKAEAGDLLVSVRAPIGAVNLANQKCCIGRGLAALRPYRDKCDAMYLYYLIKAGKNKLNWLGTGSTFKAITRSSLLSFNVPDYCIAFQRKISGKLWSVDKLIHQRNEQLKLFDLLIQSRFLEMFGMSEGIDKHLEDVADICSGITKGRKVLGLELREVPYMAVSNVKMGYIDLSTVKTIMATENEIEQYRLFPNDILMTEGGDPDKVGRGAIIRNPPKDCIHQNHIFRVRLHKDVLLPEFFEEYLQGNSARRYFLKAAKQTTGIASINMKQLRALPVKIPPIKVQIQYSDFVHQVDKSKLAVQKSLDELETLKKSLMQTYFG